MRPRYSASSEAPSRAMSPVAYAGRPRQVKKAARCASSRFTYPRPTWLPTMHSSPASPRSARRRCCPAPTSTTNWFPGNAAPMQLGSVVARTRAAEMPIVASVGPYALSIGTRVCAPQVCTTSSGSFSPPMVSARSVGTSAGAMRRPSV